MPGVSGKYYELGSDDWTTQNLVRSFGGQMMSDAENRYRLRWSRWLSGREPLQALPQRRRPIADRAAGRPPDVGQLGFYFASAGPVRGFEKEIGGRFKLGIRDNIGSSYL